jgi:SOS-response transcriptional repressor LexA
MTYKITPRLITLLKNELKRNGDNMAALARKIDINPSYIFKYLRGTVKSVQADTWEKLCFYFPEIDDRPMLFRGNTSPVKASFNYYPVISSEVVAEANQAFYLPIAEYAIENPDKLISFSNGKPGDFAIEVVGDSMLPWYPEGTILLLRPNVRLRNGDPVVAVLESGEIVFRIFYKGLSKVTLASLDGDKQHTYQFEKKSCSQVRTVYKVIQSMRDEKEILKAMKKHGLLRALEDYEKQ